MAVTIASRRVPVPTLVEVLLFSPSAAVAPVSAARRPFNPYAQMSDFDDEQSPDIDSRSDAAPDSRRRRRSGGFQISDAFSGPTQSRSQKLNLIEQNVVDAPLGGWTTSEDKDALYLRIDMPGLGKEHVRVSADQSTLTVKGEWEPEPEGDGDREGGPRKYRKLFALPAELFKMDQIRAEMKNGVLKVVLPKLKERKDVFQVQIA